MSTEPNTKASTVLMMNLSETNAAAWLAEQDARCLLASTTRAPGRLRRDGSQSGLDNHLVRPHPEALQDARPERGAEGDIDRVPASRHQDASDARHVVPRVEGIPMPIEPRLEPGGKVHRPVRRRGANVAQIPRAIARWDIQAPAEGDGEVGKVAADAGSFRVRFPGGPGRPRLVVVKVEVVGDEIADGLDESPARRRRAVAE